jgi:hypothetical protein
MTYHLKTLCGCEKWIPGSDSEFTASFPYLRVPLTHRRSISDGPGLGLSTAYSYRMFKLESVEYDRGLARFVEVPQ